MIPVSESDIVIIFPFDSREYVPYHTHPQNRTISSCWKTHHYKEVIASSLTTLSKILISIFAEINIQVLAVK
jgi:hypothetical protein